MTLCGVTRGGEWSEMLAVGVNRRWRDGPGLRDGPRTNHLEYRVR